jgi:diguanylate cyclase (GGDEF)-like protein/PAS domain S-box-containing protein
MSVASMIARNHFAQQCLITGLFVAGALLLYGLTDFDLNHGWQWYSLIIALWLTALLAHHLRYFSRTSSEELQRKFLLETLSSASPVILWTVDAAGVIRDVRGGALDKAGWSPADLIGRNMAMVLGGDSPMVEDIRSALDGEQFMSFKPIKDRYYRHHYYPLFTRSGQCDGFNCVSLDLSRERELDAQLQLSRQVFENTTDAIVIGDAHRRITSVNNAFTRITGYSEVEVLGKKAGLPRAREQNFAFYRKVVKRIHSGGSWHGEVWGRRKSGEAYSARMTITRIRTRAGSIHYVCFFSDVTDIKRTEEELKYLANHDNLTGLPNRRLFLDRLDQAIKRAKRLNNRMAIFYIDLDNFKLINDSLGHNFGDELLKSVARRLREMVRESDTVARLAGDEFTVIAENVRDNAEVTSIARKILSCFEEPFVAFDQEMEGTASVGIGVYPDDGDEMVALMENADMAMYKAKARGRNGYFYLAEDGSGQLPDKVFFPSELRLALKREQMSLVFQPQIDLASGDIIGCETLLRWNHHCRGQLMPGDFLAMAEEKGIISRIGAWAASEACAQYRQWHSRGVELEQLTLNIAALQLDDIDFLENLRQAMDRNNIPPGVLTVEIPEGVVVDHLERARLFIRSAHQLGISCSVDELGSVAPNYTYLQHLPLKTVKLDRRLVASIKSGREDQGMVRALVTIAALLDIRVVAVGIERPGQEETLESIGCHYGQGFLYAKPMSGDSFFKFYAASQGLPGQNWNIS